MYNVYCPMQVRIKDFNFGGDKSQIDHPDAKLLELIESYINKFCRVRLKYILIVQSFFKCDIFREKGREVTPPL